MNSDGDMSEDNDFKLNLDKDDEDYSDSSNNPYSENKSSGDKAPRGPPGAPRIRPKKAPKFSDFLNPFISLFGKHDRSYDSSNSSDNSLNVAKKKKITEMSTFQKSYVMSQKENFEKNYKILKDDIKLLEEYEKKIFKDTNLDIMFIMDLTGSMGIWLDEAKKRVTNIVEEITDNNPGSKIRISFIGYRDFFEANEKRQYDSQEFTEDINEFNNFLTKLDCCGGGDEPEDIVGALGQALNMKWESSSRYAVLVCDAPCHGKKYHKISYDKFANGDPSGVLLEDVMKQFYEKGITFYCIEINTSTKKMFKIMEEVYNDNDKFHVEKLGNSVHQFSFFVAFSASVLLGNLKYNKVKFNEVLSNYRKETIEKIMDKYINNKKINIYNNNGDLLISQLMNEVENLDLGEDKKLFDFINRMSDLNINKDNSNNAKDDYIHINIDEEISKKMVKKEVNYIIRALSYNKNLNIVNDWVNPTIQEKSFKTQLKIAFDTLKKDLNGKEYEIFVFDKILDKEKKGIIPFSINKNYFNNPSQYIKHIAYDELICEQIADYFNIMIDEKLPYIKQFIKFQRHILYEIDNPNSINDDFYKIYKYIISEYSVSLQLSGGVAASKRILHSFSHFSYQITGGQLLITDIKYDDEIKKITEFKISSLKEGGYSKILEFFSSHICDNTCKTLGLAYPRKKLNPIEVNDTFFSNKYLTDTKLCSCCSLPIHNYNDNTKLNCGCCSWKEKINKIDANCSECHSKFSYSTYVYNCQLINYPNKCEKCNINF